MVKTSKVERAKMALAQNEADWRAAWARAEQALESGENFERWLRAADEFARAAVVIRGRAAWLAFEAELDAALGAMVAA